MTTSKELDEIFTAGLLSDGKRDFGLIKKKILETISSDRKALRERLEKKLQPAFDDFSKAGQTLIKKGLVNSGSEMIENVGYMKGAIDEVLLIK